MTPIIATPDPTSRTGFRYQVTTAGSPTTVFDRLVDAIAEAAYVFGVDQYDVTVRWDDLQGNPDGQ